GAQRDDDHDGFGNVCDGKFTTVGTNVGPADTAQFQASNGKSRTTDTCGTVGTRSCAIFDIRTDDGVTNINAADLADYRLLIGSPAGPKCPSCPLACAAGTAGDCSTPAGP